MPGLSLVMVFWAGKGRVAVPGTSVVELQGAVDEGEVAEGLGGVAQLPLVLGVPFFAEQADVVPKAEEAVKELDGFVVAANAEEGVNEPEGAGEEDAFGAGQPVVACLRVVAEDESALR
ncbi:hypothetical protein ABIE00_000235 [Arthrobacter sp. OAP107]